MKIRISAGDSELERERSAMSTTQTPFERGVDRRASPASRRRQMREQLAKLLRSRFRIINGGK